mgnify:CR=1 FL=1
MGTNIKFVEADPAIRKKEARGWMVVVRGGGERDMM